MDNTIVKCRAVISIANSLTCCNIRCQPLSINELKIKPLRPIKGPEKYVYYGSDGTQAFERIFNDADLFSERLAKVSKQENNIWRTVFINEKGETVFEATNHQYDSGYKDVTGFWNRMAWAKKQNGTYVALNT